MGEEYQGIIARFINHAYEIGRQLITIYLDRFTKSGKVLTISVLGAKWALEEQILDECTWRNQARRLSKKKNWRY